MTDDKTLTADRFDNLHTVLAYLPSTDWRKVVYWFAAAALTYVVTY